VTGRKQAQGGATVSVYVHSMCTYGKRRQTKGVHFVVTCT